MSGAPCGCFPEGNDGDCPRHGCSGRRATVQRLTAAQLDHYERTGEYPAGWTAWAFRFAVTEMARVCLAPSASGTSEVSLEAALARVAELHVQLERCVEVCEDYGEPHGYWLARELRAIQNAALQTPSTVRLGVAPQANAMPEEGHRADPRRSTVPADVHPGTPASAAPTDKPHRLLLKLASLIEACNKAQDRAVYEEMSHAGLELDDFVVGEDGDELIRLLRSTRSANTPPSLEVLDLLRDAQHELRCASGAIHRAPITETRIKEVLVKIAAFLASSSTREEK